MFQERLKGVSRDFKEDLRVIKESFNGVLRKVQGGCKESSREVSWNIEGCFGGA